MVLKIIIPTLIVIVLLGTQIIFGLEIPKDIKKTPLNGPFRRVRDNKIENTTLNDDFQDFKNILMNKADLILILLGNYMLDKQFRDDIKIFYGDDMKKVIEDVDKLPEYEQFIAYLYANDVEDVYIHIALIHELLQLLVPPFVQEHLPVKRNVFAMGKPGLMGFLENLNKLIDSKALVDLYFDKLQNSESFQEFVNYLRSDKFLVIVRTVQNSENYENLVNDAIDIGINVDKIRRILNKLFGW